MNADRRAHPRRPVARPYVAHLFLPDGSARLCVLADVSRGRGLQLIRQSMDHVMFDRGDGTTIGFRVVGVSRVPKTNFPTDLVYSPTLQPSLQLVTCGGSFDYHARSYRDNVIVYTVPS